MNKQEAIEVIKEKWFSEDGNILQGLQDIIDTINKINEPEKAECVYNDKGEKLYTVEIPNPNSKYTSIVLQRLNAVELHLKEYTNVDWKLFKMNQLTEAEIKKDFEWAWQWAVPVEVE